MTIPVPRRPPMPYATLPTPTTPPTGSGVVRAVANDNTPLGSPSLATYRPPEEFKDDDVEEGSALSSASRSGPGYFDGVEKSERNEQEQSVDKGKGKGKGKERADDVESENMRREHAKYFREVESLGEGEKEGNGESRWSWSDTEGFIPNGGSGSRLRSGIDPQDVVVEDAEGEVRAGPAARDQTRGAGGDESPPPLIYVPSDSEDDDEEEEDGAVRGLEPIGDAPVVWGHPARRGAFMPGGERVAFVPGGERVRLLRPGAGIPPHEDAGLVPVLPAERPEGAGEGEQGVQPEFLDDEFAGEDDMEGAFEGEFVLYFEGRGVDGTDADDIVV